MPLYDIICPEAHKSERFIPLEKFEEPIICACGLPARRAISAPMFTVDHTGYSCPVTGDWIGSKAAHRENLDKHGCRVLETGETEQYKSSKAREEAEFDKKIEATVEKTIETWSSDKKEALHNELVNGKLDVAIERK